MTVFLLLFGSIFLIINYIYSSIYSRTNISEVDPKNYSNLRYIFNETGTKLCADFECVENARKFAVLYLGYGCDYKIIAAIKDLYLKQNIGVITIYANGYSKSCGKKKQSESVLATDLEYWLSYISEIFGQNCKIILHGFSSTALSCFLCSNSKQVRIEELISDSAHIYPLFIYKDIKNSIILKFFKKKSRVNLPEINTKTLIISSKNLSNDSYKLYDLCKGQKTIYIYEDLDLNKYIKKLQSFLFKHSAPPEE